MPAFGWVLLGRHSLNMWTAEDATVNYVWEEEQAYLKRAHEYLKITTSIPLGKETWLQCIFAIFKLQRF